MDWSVQARSLAFLLDGQGAEGKPDADFFVMLNGHPSRTEVFTTPKPRSRKIWRKIIDTAAPPPLDIMEEPKGMLLTSNNNINVEPMAAVVLISATR